jgi:ABC-type cobalamin/Fe3+-siderophores transport system ATPase subunit
MRISKFEIKNQRSVALAKCDAVPRLMVITGPNGAGKSTLLYDLRHVDGRQHILYVGPHRSTRRQHVQQRHLLSRPLIFEDMLCADQAQQYEGIQVVQGLRDPWSADDSANYLKHSLCQIEIERQQAIATRYERDGEILRGSLADPWEPLKTLASSLLPHLRFARIDNSNRDQIRCVWQVHGKDIEVDFDDLSSGEKSVIQMFFPLLEHQIRGILQEIQKGQALAERPETCVLIDEPELHLHPNLQVKVFDYLRVLTSSEKTQAIVVSHSPTIVEHASFEELFLLRPVELVSTGENQLIQIANDEDRLKMLREVFGTTSNVTAMQPVVIVEGIPQDRSSSTVSDRKLYRALCKDFDAITVIPGGGKSDCIRLLSSISGLLSQLSTSLRAVALVDRDVGGETGNPNVHVLPVSMIENFLLDPLPLWEAIQSVAERSGFSTIEQLTDALDATLDSMELEEIDRRTRAALGATVFRPCSPISEISSQAAAASAGLLAKYSSENVERERSDAQAKVDSLRDTRQRREHFHGKHVLEEFYRKHLHQTGLSKEVFKFEAARHARERRAVREFFCTFFDSLLEREKRDQSQGSEGSVS